MKVDGFAGCDSRVGGASRSQHRGLLVGVDALLLRRLHQLGQQMVVLKVLKPCINHFIIKTADETWREVLVFTVTQRVEVQGGKHALRPG